MVTHWPRNAPSQVQLARSLRPDAPVTPEHLSLALRPATQPSTALAVTSQSPIRAARRVHGSGRGSGAPVVAGVLRRADVVAALARSGALVARRGGAFVVTPCNQRTHIVSSIWQRETRLCRNFVPSSKRACGGTCSARSSGCIYLIRRVASSLSQREVSPPKAMPLTALPAHSWPRRRSPMHRKCNAKSWRASARGGRRSSTGCDRRASTTWRRTRSAQRPVRSFISPARARLARSRCGTRGHVPRRGASGCACSGTACAPRR